jgi:hypothetical protein
MISASFFIKLTFKRPHRHSHLITPPKTIQFHNYTQPDRVSLRPIPIFYV